MLIKAIRHVIAQAPGPARRSRPGWPARSPRPDLSPAQHRVLPLYASGMTLDKVARQLGISTGTASTHLKRARLKYAEPDRPAGTRVDLYRQAIADGDRAPLGLPDRASVSWVWDVVGPDGAWPRAGCRV